MGGRTEWQRGRKRQRANRTLNLLNWPCNASWSVEYFNNRYDTHISLDTVDHKSSSLKKKKIKYHIYLEFFFCLHVFSPIKGTGISFVVLTTLKYEVKIQQQCTRFLLRINRFQRDYFLLKKQVSILKKSVDCCKQTKTRRLFVAG